MNFVTQSGGSAPPAQTFQILNPGSGSMQWSISTKVLSGSSWLSVSPNSGKLAEPLAGRIADQEHVSVNPQGLAGGVYYGSVIVASSGAFNGPQMITVVFSVGPQGTNPPELATPNGVVLTGSGSQTVTLTNPGGNSVTFSSAAITDDGQNWLTVSPSSGTIAAGATNAITLSASSSGLSSGLRHGTLQIRVLRWQRSRRWMCNSHWRAARGQGTTGSPCVRFLQPGDGVPDAFAELLAASGERRDPPAGSG